MNQQGSSATLLENAVEQIVAAQIVRGDAAHELTKVIVVDDDPDIRQLVAMKLGNAGYDVSVEADGESGLAAAQEEPPDLVVLDWMMPGLTGIEVCRAIRDDPRMANTAVLLLTARSQELDIERGFAAGADDYLVKPFSVQVLAARVERMLARRR